MPKMIDNANLKSDKSKKLYLDDQEFSKTVVVERVESVVPESKLFQGWRGEDVLNGGNGDDTLNGGAGDDT